MEIYIVYFTFFFLLALIYDIKPFVKWPYVIIIVIMLGLMAGLQAHGVSKDSNNYHQIFFSSDLYMNKIKSGDWFTNIEPGCILIFSTLKQIFPANYTTAILLFFAFSSLTMKIYVIDKITFNPFVAILFYYSYYFYLAEMTQIRMGLASAFLFVAFLFFLNNKKILFSIFVLVASLFHYSALLYFLIFAFNTSSFNKFFYSAVIILSIIFAFMRLPIFDFISGDVNLGKIDAYRGVASVFTLQKINPFNAIIIVNLIFIVYAILFISDALLKADRLLVLSLKCNILSIFILHLFSGIPSLVYRLSEIFSMLSIFMFGAILKYLPFGKLNVIVLLFFAALFCYINLFYLKILKPYELSFVTN